MADFLLGVLLGAVVVLSVMPLVHSYGRAAEVRDQESRAARTATAELDRRVSRLEVRRGGPA